MGKRSILRTFPSEPGTQRGPIAIPQPAPSEILKKVLDRVKSGRYYIHIFRQPNELKQAMNETKGLLFNLQRAGVWCEPVDGSIHNIPRELLHRIE